MTGEEFIFLSKHASGQTEMQPQPVTDTVRVQPAHRQPHQEKRKDRQSHYANRAQDYRGCGACT